MEVINNNYGKMWLILIKIYQLIIWCWDDGTQQWEQKWLCVCVCVWARGDMTHIRLTHLMNSSSVCWRGLTWSTESCWSNSPLLKTNKQKNKQTTTQVTCLPQNSKRQWLCWNQQYVYCWIKSNSQWRCCKEMCVCMKQVQSRGRASCGHAEQAVCGSLVMLIHCKRISFLHTVHRRGASASCARSVLLLLF